MEGFIIFIIIAIISAIFKSGDIEKKSTPDFGGKNPKKLEQPKGFSFEDLTKDIFHKLEDVLIETAETKKEQQKKANKNTEKATVIEPVEEKIPKEKTIETREVQTNPIYISNESKKQGELPNFIPVSKDALVQSIITSEILGPPVSKRRK